MTSDVSAALAALVRSVRDTPGATEPALRAAAFTREQLPEPIESYVAKVHEASYRVTDGDIAALRAADYSEDAIFEVTLAAALGAASRRLDAGLSVLPADRDLDVRSGVLERGRGWIQGVRLPIGRVRLRVRRLLGRPETNPVTKAVLYRPRLFGRHWLWLARSVLQGPSDWSAGERELLGAHVSRLNACPFCAEFHEAAAVRLLGANVTARSMEHGREGRSDPRLAATMDLLEKATLAPDDLERGDIEAVRAAGVSYAAIREALYVGFVFNAVNRIVNALGDT